MAFAQHQHVFIVECVQRNPFVFRERMAGRQQHLKRLVIQWRDNNTGFRERQGNEDGVYLAVAESLRKSVSEIFLDPEWQLWCDAARGTDQSGEQIWANGVDCTDAQRGAELLYIRVSQLAEFLRFLKHALGLGDHGFTCWRYAHVVAVPLEQLDAEFILELFHRHRQCWLGDGAAHCGAAEMALAGEGDGVAQFGKVHGGILTMIRLRWQPVTCRILVAYQGGVNAGGVGMATVLFAGFGDLGSAAGQLLAAAGLRVLALKRTAPTARLPGIDYHAVDLRAPFILPPALRAQADAVVIVVSPKRHVREGDAREGDSREDSREDYAATYIGAVEHTLRAVHEAGGRPKLVLFISSTSVWSESADLWLTEDVPARPDSWNGEILLRAEEKLFSSSLLTTGTAATVLRLAGIYGPGRHMLVRKAEAIIAGKDAWPAPAWTNRIHRDDAARLIAFLVNRALAGITLDRVYTGVDNEPSLNIDVLAFIAARLQGRESEINFAEKAPLANVSVGGKRVGNARIRALGFQFGYPDFRSGYTAVLAQR